MKFLRNLFTKNKKPMRWNQMPRNGFTLLEKIEKEHEALSASGVKIYNYISVSDIAENYCICDVPTFYSLNNTVNVVLKLKPHPKDNLNLLEKAVTSGKITMDTRYKAMPTFPIIGFIFEIPVGSQILPVEAIPNITDADIRDCLEILLQKDTGKFYFFYENPIKLIGEGLFSVKSLANLSRSLDKASSHYFNIDSNKLDYMLAVKEYIATTTL